MLPIFLIFIIAAMVLSPYAIMLFRRYKILKEIINIATRCGFKAKILNRVVFFARNRGVKYDLLFVGKTRVYAVKLWSALYSDSTLVVCPNNKYYVARGVSEPFDQKGRGEYHLRDVKKKAPETVIDFKIRGERETVPVLLLYPAYKKIMQRNGNDIAIYEQGDLVFGKKMYSADRFKEMLFESADTVTTSVSNIKAPGKPSKKR